MEAVASGSYAADRVIDWPLPRRAHASSLGFRRAKGVGPSLQRSVLRLVVLMTSNFFIVAGDLAGNPQLRAPALRYRPQLGGSRYGRGSGAGLRSG